jgi:predicted small integral membrane protein
MNDIFSKEKNGWRSINNESLHYLFFIIIISWELSIAVLMWLGAFRMISKFRASPTLARACRPCFSNFAFSHSSATITTATNDPARIKNPKASTTTPK